MSRRRRLAGDLKSATRRFAGAPAESAESAAAAAEIRRLTAELELLGATYRQVVKSARAVDDPELPTWPEPTADGDTAPGTATPDPGPDLEGEGTDALPERVMASRKSLTTARLTVHGIPTRTIDAWIGWWEANETSSRRDQPAFWQQAYEHIRREWDAGRTTPPDAPTGGDERAP